jgi:hypothetical protein
MLKPTAFCCILVAMMLPLSLHSHAQWHASTLAAGAWSSDFKLLGVDGNTYTLASFSDMRHRYRNRGFEIVVISADSPAKKDEVLKFLQSKHASNTRYLICFEDKYRLIEAVELNWQGPIVRIGCGKPSWKTGTWAATADSNPLFF